MTEQNAQQRRLILNRLRRAQGQLGAVIAAVEAEAECRDVITQLSACTSALERAGFAIMGQAMRNCAAEDAEDSAERLDELEKLFLTLA